MGTAKFCSALLLGVSAFVLFSGAAHAGENAGAALLVSTGSVTKATPASCAALSGKTCGDLTPNADTQLAPLLSWIAVYVGRSPDLTQLAGVDFGINYNPDALFGAAWTHCGSLEVQGTEPPWPQPGSGTTVVWTENQIGPTVLVGFFTVAKYGAPYTAADHTFTLQQHPLYGVARATDGQIFDNLRNPAIANLSGVGGGNPDCSTAIKPTTWGGIKSLYQH
jgi:hypothetical protein